MPSDVTLFSNDKQWKIVVSAFKKNWLVYRSLGVEVTTYHLESTHRFLWFGRKTDFVEKPSSELFIRNKYLAHDDNDHPMGSVVLEYRKTNSSSLEAKLFSVGASIKINTDGPSSPRPGGAGAPDLIADGVIGNVTVIINGAGNFNSTVSTGKTTGF
jgi:hypothetical protein